MVESTRPSRPYWRMKSRLDLTLNHMLIVDKALIDIVSKTGKDRAVCRHAITRNAELAVQLLYTHLTAFLQEITSEIYQSRPLEIVGKVSSSLQFHEIVKLGTLEAIHQHMVDRVFRTLEGQRSTRVLIEKILDKTGVLIKAEIFDDTLCYLEIRHLIVHYSSLIDAAFEERCSSRFRYCKAGNKLPMSISLAKKAIKSLDRLCHEIDDGLVCANYLKSQNPVA